MNALKNEKGAALITVFLIFTIFTILGLTIIGFTISNAKQINKTEEDIQTTDIAEMGFQFFFTAFESAFNEVTTEDEDDEPDDVYDALDKRMKEVNEDPVFSEMTKEEKEEYYQEFAINKLHSFIIRELVSNSILEDEDNLRKTFDVSSDREFTITINEFYCEDPNKPNPPNGEVKGCVSPSAGAIDGNAYNYTNIILDYTSLGKFKNNNDLKQNIGATFVIKVGFNLVTDEDGEYDTEEPDNPDNGSSDPPGYELFIPKPTKPNIDTIEQCNTKNDTDCLYEYNPDEVNQNDKDIFKNKTTLVEGELESKANVSFNDSILYVTGGGTFNHTIEQGIVDSNLYFGGTSSFQNINGFERSTLYIENGEATFHSPINQLDEAKIFIGAPGPATFKNINQIYNSFIIVDGDAYFNNGGGNINDFHNSKIYVSGDADFDGGHINQFGEDSLLCVYGQINNIHLQNNKTYNIYAKNGSEYVDAADEDTFLEKCGVGGEDEPTDELTPENLDFLWNFNSTDIEYYYN